MSVISLSLPFSLYTITSVSLGLQDKGIHKSFGIAVLLLVKSRSQMFSLLTGLLLKTLSLSYETNVKFRENKSYVK